MTGWTGEGNGTAAGAGPWLSRRTLLVLGLLGATSGFSAPSVQDPEEEPDNTGDTTMSNTGRVAAPGDVQNALDAAAGGRASKVHLQPEITYDPDTPWEVKSGVTLDYNSASVELTSDIDLHHIHPGGCVERPLVDLRTVAGGYSSSVFVFDSKQYGFYGPNATWHVCGGFTEGTLSGGTLYEFVQGNETSIYFVHADHAVRNIGTVVDMHREDPFGINGNRITGLWYGFETGIRMRNRRTPGRETDNISGNEFDVIAQPTDGTEMLWDMEVGRYNVVRGRVWDFSKFGDVLWRIHDGNVNKRIGNILQWFPVGGRKDALVDRIGSAVFDDRLGDERNRVVIPWLQGLPVTAFDG